ncbi:phosphohistidine phosphatase [Sphingobacteriales bacterium UPWRP_1]|nr:hypothetical protein B6N25_15655 [Sphingobacteriales bacterium TSM_CSS]PSJ74549.1 phosphohistidine phosphatase [Sphingobacteriales bacterium UPWRP_1]
MKTLYIVRHAKSSWKEAGLEDIDRPLNERGKHDAPEMGKYLKQQGVKPDALYSSPAKRAQKTAQLIAAELGFDKDKISIQPVLYTFNPNVEAILNFIAQLPDEQQTVMLFGHNPTFTELANHFTKNRFTAENPTCSVVGLQLHINTWKKSPRAEADLHLFASPKKSF